MSGQQHSKRGRIGCCPMVTTKDACVVETTLEEAPETVADEHEQELPAHEESEKEESEVISLVQCSAGGGGGGCGRCEVDG